MVNSEIIINKLKEQLEPVEYIYAMWLEGTNAIDEEDQYSDLDVYIDVKDEFIDEAVDKVEAVLAGISEIDYKYVMKHPHSKLRQRIYHLKCSSEYLMIDFMWQLHSRDKDEFTYIKGNKIETAKVVFDKAEVIRYKDYNENEYKQWNEDRLKDAEYRYSQHNRVIKYVKRGTYLEAYAYYNRYVLEPLIDVLRLIYTPAFAHYYLIHISKHIPKADAEKLQFFAKISSLEEIEKKVPLAEEWFKELLKRLEEVKNNGNNN